MRTLAIGDIHGCYRALSILVERVPIAPDDLVVTLGDYVDRGPRSRDVLDWLLARHKTGHLVALRGNHEIMMLAARTGPTALENWLDVGGKATLRSYAGREIAARKAVSVSGGRAALAADAATQAPLDVVPAEHWQFIEMVCRDVFEQKRHFFVHASAEPGLDLDEQPEYALYWDKIYDEPAPHASGKIMICGHTPQKKGEPRNFGHAVCIDTWACGGGWLTCLDVDSGQYWQANETGQFRKAVLK